MRFVRVVNPSRINAELQTKRPLVSRAMSGYAAMLWMFAAILFICAAPAQSRAADMKLEAQLIWGTNDKSTDPKLKTVDADAAKKLESLPFKWKYYYVMTSKQFSVAKDAEHTEKLSKDCSIKVKNLGRSQVEVTVVGKEKPIGKITQALPKGELLITGGNAENSTAWLVAIKQVD